MKKKTVKQQFFTNQLLNWFATNDRPLPWKNEKNPYYIWLSEIILQQTRVAQGLPYFEKFKANFPTVTDLANAPEDKVMKLWEGLGYYSRARNLHFTAKFIANELNGQFPDTHSAILNLKGVGPYTAAAIASFAFNLPHAVVDGNVFRVLSRVFGIETPIDTTAGKKEFNQLADDLLDKKQPGTYNQAIMDFGATQCVPVNPNCTVCPMQTTCAAYAEGLIGVLPVKSKKIKKRDRYFNYLICSYKDIVYLNKRIQKDIWRNLYDFPLIEADELLEEPVLTNHKTLQRILGTTKFTIKKKSKPFKQLLTHQRIIAVFWELELEGPLAENEFDFFEVKQKNINNFAFPKIVDLYFKDKSLYLELF
ncbi:MAG: A/G-specific adenine glycosylase [Bacteroidota bacterium]